MPSSRQTVVETPAFIRDAKDAGISEHDRIAIVDAIAARPQQGDLVPGSGGIRKVRFAGRGKGKSGGHRVMVGYVGLEAPVYLLAILSKGDATNFSAVQIEAMRQIMTNIKANIRRRQ